MIQVVVVDDVVDIANSIAHCLSNQPDIEVVAVGHNGLDAINLAAQYLPDVLVLDLDMPVLNGLQALARIKENSSCIEVLVLTVHKDDVNLFTALQYGASGYMLKKPSVHDIPQAVRDVANGDAPIPPSLVARMIAEFNRLSAQNQSLKNVYSVLSPKEAQVLALIGQSKLNREIAEELSMTIWTLKKHITNIRKKLVINGRMGRMETELLAQQCGLADKKAD